MLRKNFTFVVSVDAKGNIKLTHRQISFDSLGWLSMRMSETSPQLERCLSDISAEHSRIFTAINTITCKDLIP